MSVRLWNARSYRFGAHVTYYSPKGHARSLYSEHRLAWLQEYSATVLCRGRILVRDSCLGWHWDLWGRAQKETDRGYPMAKDLHLVLHAVGLQKLKKEGKGFVIRMLGYVLVISVRKGGEFEGRIPLWRR